MSFPYTVYLDEAQVVSTSSVQKTALGTRGVTNDGRIFRYAHADATAIATNNCCITCAQGPGSTATDQFAYSPYVAGTTFVKLALSTVALPLLVANYFKDGWLINYSTDSGYNQSCPIDSHAALVSSTALGQITGIYLKQPGLKKTADTDTGRFKLVCNPYDHLIVAPAAFAGIGYPVGVTPCNVAASYYFWLQTWGPSLVRVGEAQKATIDTLVSLPLGNSTAVAGSFGGPLTMTASGTLQWDTDSGISRFYGNLAILMTAAPADTFFTLADLRFAP